jgi:alpha/beta superfamily hydrolase
VPLVLAGWSFGADMALSTVDDRLAGWLAIAPPLRFAADLGPVAADPRPKQLVLGQHDEFRDPASVVEATEDWVATEIEVIAGASHFFVGRTDRVVAAAQSFVDRVGPATNSTLTN